jgi:hypothetical protein
MNETQIISSPPRLWPFHVMIVAIVLAALYPLCVANFSWWDDQMTIHQNPLINSPTLSSLGFYWTTFKDGLYVPITFTVWAALAKVATVADPGDENIFLNPWFFHSTNVFLHLFSSLLVFGILRRLTRRIDAAFIGALFFGLHPVQVESVGWVSGMKDVLCWTFALSIVLLYIRRVQAVQRDGEPLWKSFELPLCALLLVLGILSKPTAMVTPVALLVIDGLLLRKKWVKPFLELLPLFAITGGGAVVARLAQHTDAVLKAALWQRPFVVGDNTVFYLGKILWPQRLCIDYARTADVLMASPLVYVKWIIPAVLVIAAIRWHKRRPMFAAGLAIFFIGFAPVSGLATFQMQNISFTTDHYLYFSMLGISLIAAWTVTLVPKNVAYALSGLILVALGARSHLQTTVWGDNKLLFASTIKANPQSAVARNNLAAMYMGGFYPRHDLAEPLLEEAVQLRPKLVFSWANLGRAQVALGKDDKAVESLNMAWRVSEAQGGSMNDRSNLARSIAEQMELMDKIDEALSWAQKAEKILPDDLRTRQMIARLKSKAAARRAQPTTNPALPAGSASSP